MLRNAGVDFTVQPADIDEEIIAQNIDDIHKVASVLAKEKALYVSKQKKDVHVIGSDQTLICGDQLFSKAPNKEAAIEKIKTLQGQTHQLNSAVSVAKNGAILWSAESQADMTMHTLSDTFITRYAQSAGDVLTQCVGAYAYEEHGAWLFEKVVGDYFTILGMPLPQLLHYLRTEQGVTL